MRSIYHLCWTSHDEVQCRSEDDLIRLFNSIAEATLETESRLLADSEMTTHCHTVVACDDLKKFAQSSRYKYSRYFNAKYGRTGSLGDKKYFVLEIDGSKHIQTALSYVFRQGMHHGLSSIPFGYQFNSVNCIYMKELGKESDKKMMPQWLRHKYLSHNNEVNESIRMSANGSLFREDVIDTKFVEELYVSPKNFLFQMIRRSGSDWEEEQKNERSHSDIITLDKIEPKCFGKDIPKMISNEFGRNDKSQMTDIELCTLVDNHFVKRYCKKSEIDKCKFAPSIYMLNTSQRKDLANTIWELSRNRKIKYVSEDQIKRCILITSM